MEVQSLLTRLRTRFNISAAEVDHQDVHQTLTVGIAAIAASTAQADSILENVLRFIESSSEAQIVSVERECR